MFGTPVITVLLSRRAEGSSAFPDPIYFPRGDQQLHLMQQGDLILSKEKSTTPMKKTVAVELAG
jgi:hypothetical protein